MGEFEPAPMSSQSRFVQRGPKAGFRLHVDFWSRVGFLRRRRRDELSKPLEFANPPDKLLGERLSGATNGLGRQTSAARDPDRRFARELTREGRKRIFEDPRRETGSHDRKLFGRKIREERGEVRAAQATEEIERGSLGDLGLKIRLELPASRLRLGFRARIGRAGANPPPVGSLGRELKDLAADRPSERRANPREATRTLGAFNPAAHDP